MDDLNPEKYIGKKVRVVNVFLDEEEGYLLGKAGTITAYDSMAYGGSYMVDFGFDQIRMMSDELELLESKLERQISKNYNI